MSSSRTRLVAFLSLAALMSTACRREPEPRVRRVALLPFENLSAEPSLDWMGRAIPGLLASQTAPARDMTPVEARAPRDVSALRATHSLQGYYVKTSGGIRIVATLRDEKAQSNTAILNAQGDLLASVETVAKGLTPQARPYGSRNAEAIRAFYSAPGEADAERKLALYTAAIQADASFAAAHLARAQLLLASGRRDEASQALAAAASQSASFDPLDRARLDWLQAGLSGDRARQSASLQKLAQATPADVNVWRSLGELELINKDFPKAVEAYERASALEPANTAFWNLLGYARAYNNDLDGAVRALEEYRRLAPGDANAFDSLGEVHYMHARFAEAEKHFLAAHQKNSAHLGGGELYRVAMCRLMTGDLAGAEQRFREYRAFRDSLGDATVPLRQALWDYSVGRRSLASTTLENLTSPPDVAALAQAQLALWDLEAGRVDDARTRSRQALALARTQPVRNTAGLIALMTGAASAAQTPPPVVAYTHLLAGRWREAADLFRQIYAALPESAAGETKVMLAWALLESGQDAATLLARLPVPGFAPEPGLSPLVFPRVLDLKARTEEKAGRTAEAKRWRDLYNSYTTPQQPSPLR